jgi:7,8-dihydropterin-6-yl-methyl-4-(beta-D-ribofuranosyl)aminobenzene 5'-phosphate synthase
MKVQCLAENTAISEQYNFEHGLSLYIETTHHKLLFDMGASELFAENAAKMGVDLTAVDTVILSHGHYDHGGGLKKFLELNDKAKVYIHKKAFEAHYANRENEAIGYIGLDKGLMTHDQIVFTEDQYTVDEELKIFSNVSGHEFWPSGNHDLFKLENGKCVEDDFAHEQNLVISEGGMTTLVAGCAHHGILNILNEMSVTGIGRPDNVIGGFHLYSRSTQKSEPTENVNILGQRLKNTSAKYFTCHCTGQQAFLELKKIMGVQIEYLSTGQTLVL